MSRDICTCGEFLEIRLEPEEWRQVEKCPKCGRYFIWDSWTQEWVFVINEDKLSEIFLEGIQ